MAAAKARASRSGACCTTRRLLVRYEAAFDVSSPELVSSDDVLRTVRMQCTSTGMTPPETPAEVTRCILQSLALTYRRTIDLCEQLTDKPVEEVHMIGGGSLNPLLRQLTADACGRPCASDPSRPRRSAAWPLKLVAVGSLSDEAALQSVLQAKLRRGIADAVRR